MSDVAAPVTRLIDQFKKLPGVGAKTAQRLAFFVLKMDAADAGALAEAIVEVKRSIRRCSVCNNLTDVDPCHFCTHPSRSDKVLCVVEESNDILPLEKTRSFQGRYHVLMGAISPLKGVTPDRLAVPSLLRRLQSGEVEEVIVATNPNAEGETTAMYLSRLIKPLGIRVTRIGLGLPVGGDLEYADEVTMSKALEGRREI
ncbi:MAG TPA: recombination mediator RecR [Terriglobia bacterium]|nr:recombination mediator RecR [Terriglobia bacterium]